MPTKATHIRRVRPAFTLMELMVSVAILLAIMALIGTIFSTASKAGGKATAITTVYRQLRQAAELIRQDLEGVTPSTDVLGIAGVEVLAKGIDVSTDAGRRNPEASGGHRADLLMMFTNRGDARPSRFKIAANYDDYLAQKMEVVYGHADTGVLDQSRGFVVRTKQLGNESLPSEIPATNWHLARRTIPFLASAGSYDPYPTNRGLLNGPLSRPEFLGTQNTASGFTDYPPADTLANTADIAFITDFKGILEYRDQGVLDRGYFTDGTKAYLYTKPDSSWWLGKEWLYFDAYWHVPSTVGTNQWSRNGDTVFPSQPYLIDAPPWWPLLTNYQGTDSFAARLFYNDLAGTVNRRTVIDPNPPTGFADAMSSQFLPNCSDFRVEYTYDDPREVGDPRQDIALVYGKDPLNQSNTTTFVHPIRWQVVPSGRQIVWSQLSTVPADRTNPFRWPRALRITLRCWDAGGRLDEPVSYTLIHTWPSGD